MKDIITAILIIAVLVLVLEPKKSNPPIVITKYDTIVEIKNIVKYKRGESIPFVVLDTIVKIEYDTIRIMSDYNRIYAYSDTIRKDSNIFVIDDTISQNRIIARGFKAELTQKTIILREFYASKPTNTLYWGIRGSYSPLNGLEVLSPSLMLSVRNKALIGLSVDISKNYNIGYSGGIYFKIGK